MVLQPTRGDSILDLVLTNNSDVICDVEVGEPISDHNIISFNVNFHPYHQKSSGRGFYDFNKADWLRLNELFKHIPWHCAFLSNGVNEVWSVWTDLFFTAVDECISKRRKKKNRWAPWISAEIIKLRSDCTKKLRIVVILSHGPLTKRQVTCWPTRETKA